MILTIIHLSGKIADIKNFPSKVYIRGIICHMNMWYSRVWDEVVLLTMHAYINTIGLFSASLWSHNERSLVGV